MIINWKKFIFSFTEIYANATVPKDFPKTDVHAYFQQKSLVETNRPLTIHKQTLTLCIDLNKTEDELRKEMNRTTRYQINKGSRDNLRIEYITEPTMKDIEEFEAFFNPFAKEKKIALCKVNKLISFMKAGRLIITYALHEDGRRLASHLYIVNEKRAVMFYSCSGRFSNSDIPQLELGRANRYLHWKDILFFKYKNYDYYDFLGLSIDKNNKAQQNINKFKKGFGGFEVVEHQSYIAQNMRGMLLLFALRLMWRKQHELIRGEQLPVSRYLTSMEESK